MTTLPSQADLANSSYSAPIAGQLQDTSSARDINNVDCYRVMEQTYDGSAGYRDNTYLIPFDRESFYGTRRKISYYVNVFKPIINAMVDPVFSQDIKRETSNDMFQGFIENCDNAGTSLNVFMKNAIKNARLFSIDFIVMDNFNAGTLDEEETAEQMINNRKYPYIYEKKPYEVHEHDTNEQGALTSITFLDRCEEMTIDGKKKEVQLYREWDAVGWTLYYYDSKENEIEVESGVHGLGMIPVIPIIDFAQTASMLKMPHPQFYDMAKLCHGLFNKESQVVLMEQYQTFALLCVSGMGKNAIVAGATTFIDSGTDSKFPPQYVAPPQEGIKVLIDNCQRLKEEIKDQAKQKGVIGVKTASSGIAKEWDFRAEEQVLLETANAGERVEMLLSEIFSAYIGSDVGYVVEYPDRFDPKADENAIAERLLILKDVTDRTIIKYINLDIAERLWGNNPDKLDAIKAEMETKQLENMTIAAMHNEPLIA